VGDDRHVLVALDLKSVGIIRVGLAAARHPRMVGLHQFPKPGTDGRIGRLPLAIVTGEPRRLWRKQDSREREAAKQRSAVIIGVPSQDPPKWWRVAYPRTICMQGACLCGKANQ